MYLYYIFPSGAGATRTVINNGVFYSTLYTNGNSTGYSGNYSITINDGTFYQSAYLASGQTDLRINGGVFDLKGDSQSIVEIRGGNLHIAGGSFTADLDTSSNEDQTEINGNGSSYYKGLFVAVKPDSASATGYTNDITINIEGGYFENENGEHLVLVNHSNPSLEYTISATVKNGLIPFDSIAKYDKTGSPESVFDLSYRVVFEDINGDILLDTNVPHGESATAPTAPILEGKTFEKWDTAFDAVTSNLTVTAVYKDDEVEPPVVEEPVAELDETLKDIIDADKVVVNVPEGAFETPVEKFEFTKPELDEKATAALEEELVKLFEDSTSDVTNFLVLTISPLDAAGNKLQVAEGEFVEISIPVPAGLNVEEKFAVFHINADGTLTELETTYDSETGIITFKATEFSDFVIANVLENTTPPVDGGETLPETGMVAPLYGVGMAGLGLVVLALGKKRSRED